MDKWSDTVFYYEKGHNQHQHQQAPSAVVSYKRALSIDSKTDTSYDDLGSVLYEQKSYAGAAKFFHRAHIRIPYIPEISFCWGLCLSKEKKYKKAEERFRAVIADPFKSIARAPCELGKALFHQHLYREALEVLEKDALRYPLSKEVNAKYQEALFYIGDFEKAKEASINTLQRWPGDSTANNVRGLLFLVEGCEEEAIKCFEKAVSSDKEETYAWANWSMMLLRQGNKREAMKILKKGRDCIEEGVNIKDEIEEIFGHYQFLSDMLERKCLQASDEKEKTGLEKTASSFKLILEYLENPNLSDIIEVILNEENEEKLEENRFRNSEDKAHQQSEEGNKVENLKNKLLDESEVNAHKNKENFANMNDSPIEENNRFDDMLNCSDFIFNKEVDKSEEEKSHRSEKQKLGENEKSYKQNKNTRNGSSININNQKYNIFKKYFFLIAFLIFFVLAFIFHKILKNGKDFRFSELV